MHQELISHFLGWIAVSIGLFSLFFKDDRKLLFFQIGVNILFSIHFLLAGYTSSSVIMLIIAIRILFAYRYNNDYTYLFFMVVPFLQGFYMYFSDVLIFEYFGLIASIIVTHTYFKMMKIPMRIGFILGGICWCIVGFYSESHSILFINSVGILIHFTTIYRINKDNQLTD